MRTPEKSGVLAYPDSAMRMQLILREETARGVAVCTVTHDDDAVAAADRVVRLERSRVV